jgi:hypothetical protein
MQHRPRRVWWTLWRRRRDRMAQALAEAEARDRAEREAAVRRLLARAQQGNL